MSPTFASLRIRNYRRYATGQLLANTGVWMQRVAQDWLVLELTDGSPTALGITVGLQFLPILLFSAWGGGLADRFRRRRMLLLTSSLLSGLALVLGVLVITGSVTVIGVMVMAFLVGSVAAIDAPTRQAFVSEMVGRDDLTNAVALNTASFNLGRVMGPAVAGLLVAAVGSGWVFVINALGYVAVVVALLGVRTNELRAPAAPAVDGGNLRDGVRYVWARPELVLVLLIAFFVGTFGLNFQLTIASMTTVEFGLGPAQFGLASTVLAVGSLVGSLAAARRGAPRLRLVVLAAVAFGVAGVTAALMPGYLAFLFALPLVGVTALTLINATQSYLQLHSDAAFRGRVMGLYTLLFLGGTPLGAPVVGWIAATLGPRWSIALGGLISAAAAVTVAAVWLRVKRLAVRGHLTPRPHFHIGDSAELGDLRPGRRVALGTYALVIPLVATAVVAAGVGSPARAQPRTSQSDAIEVLTLQDPRIDEASGMSVGQRHPGIAWIINDSGSGPYVYAVDADGATVARLIVRDAENRDWEAMAPGVDDNGDPALWIADIGDNDSSHRSMTLYRISEPDQLADQVVEAEQFELEYPDGAHNAESLLVDPDDGSVYVVTKEAFFGTVYGSGAPPLAGATTVLDRVGNAPMFVTDGAISPNGREAALRSYGSLYRYRAEVLLGDEAGKGLKSGLPRQQQGETLAFMPEGRSVLVGTEGEFTPIYRIQLTPLQASAAPGDSPTADPGGDQVSDGNGESPTVWMALAIGGFVLLCLVVAAVVTVRARRATPSPR